MEEGGEEREDCEDVKLRHGKELRRVHVVPVTEFVCCGGSPHVRWRISYGRSRTHPEQPRLPQACFA